MYPYFDVFHDAESHNSSFVMTVTFFLTVGVFTCIKLLSVMLPKTYFAIYYCQTVPKYIIMFRRTIKKDKRKI